MATPRATPEDRTGSHEAVSPLRRFGRSSSAGDVAVLGVAAVWGSSYAVMQLVNATGLSAPNFLALRFLTAAVPLLLYAVLARVRINRSEFLYGLLYGALLFTILFLETVGVSYTSAANAGFLITVSVILVPLYSRILGGRRQQGAIYALSLLALLGCAALTLGTSDSVGFRPGDLIILAAALVRAYQIYSFGRTSSQRSFDVLSVTLVEVVVVMVLSLAVSPFWGPMIIEQVPNIPPLTWLLIAYLGVLGTAYAFAAQLFAARRTSATRVALILSTEPVFAAIFAVVLRGEQLVFMQVLGGVMIVVAAGVGRVLESRSEAVA
ncbi:DMT family transporter [Actinopolyspora mortivallis]|uniref:DMT family transporter n=1 Tax=Actinopolyspora mortivallis TaxID=33906 RepID=UPI0021595F05|nr:DMT family transporter [Actinopolyspora mortivallis]